MEMEDLVHDLPLAIQLQQREHVREARPGPVVDFEAHIRDCPDDVDFRNARLDVGGGAILVIPIVEALDRSRKEIGPTYPKIVASLWKAGFMSLPLPDFAPSR